MPLASRRFLRPLTLALVVAGLVVAGTAAAFFLRSRREVTTSSKQALKAYNEARDNDLKMYEREAISGYATALQYDPHFVMATLRLAEKIRGRDPERAKSLLMSAARWRDGLTPREQLMLKIYEERWERHDPAALGALYDEYLRRFPDDPEGYLMRCYFLASQKRTAEALAEYERLLTVNPNYATAYNVLGYASAARGDYAKAEDYLKRYRYLAPDQANPLDSLGELYALTGRYDEAEDVLKKALAVKSDFFPAYGHLGTVEIDRGNPAKAAEYFLKASDEASPDRYAPRLPLLRFDRPARRRRRSGRTQRARPLGDGDSRPSARIGGRAAPREDRVLSGGVSRDEGRDDGARRPARDRGRLFREGAGGRKERRRSKHRPGPRTRGSPVRPLRGGGGAPPGEPAAGR